MGNLSPSSRQLTKTDFYSSRGYRNSKPFKELREEKEQITIKLAKRTQVWHRPHFGIGHGLRVLILPTLVPFSNERQARELVVPCWCEAQRSSNFSAEKESTLTALSSSALMYTYIMKSA